MGTLAQLLRKIQEAQAAGKQLENPAIWANRAELTLNLVIVLNAFVYVASKVATYAGVDLEIPPNLVEDTAEVVTFAGVFLANRIHVASNKAAGK